MGQAVFGVPHPLLQGQVDWRELDRSWLIHQTGTGTEVRKMALASGNSGSGGMYQYHFQDPASPYGVFVQIRKEVPCLG